MPGHMARAERLLMDIKGHSLTILHTLSLLHVNICIHVHEDIQDNLIHQGIVDLTLIAEIDSISALLSHLEVQLCIDYGDSCNYLLIKVQVSILPSWDV